MLDFVRWLASYYLFTFAFVSLFLFCGMVTVFLSGYVIDYFGLDDDAGMYLKLGVFVAILLPILWAYDKYKEWRFFNED